MKLPILFDLTYLVQSLHPCGFDSTQSMCCLEGSVCAYWYLRNGNEGDGLEISTLWSYLQMKGEWFSLQAQTLTSLPLVPSPVAPLENSCVTGAKEKAKSTTRNSPALIFQILCPCSATTLILQTNTFLLHRQVDKIPTTVVNLILMMMTILIISGGGGFWLTLFLHPFLLILQHPLPLQMPKASH